MGSALGTVKRTCGWDDKGKKSSKAASGVKAGTGAKAVGTASTAQAAMANRRMSTAAMGKHILTSEERKKMTTKWLKQEKHYKRVFLELDNDGDGELNKTEFIQFYHILLMAGGKSKGQADEYVNATYHGKTRGEQMYSSYDKDSNQFISFDEFWKHHHTKTSLAPNSEEQLEKIKEFLKEWQPGKERKFTAKLPQPDAE